jgi:hypothetical protein
VDSGPSADTISLHLGLVLSSLFLSFIFYCSASIMGFLILLLSCSFNMFEEFEFFFSQWLLGLCCKTSILLPKFFCD